MNGKLLQKKRKIKKKVNKDIIGEEEMGYNGDNNSNVEIEAEKDCKVVIILGMGMKDYYNPNDETIFEERKKIYIALFNLVGAMEYYWGSWSRSYIFIRWKDEASAKKCLALFANDDEKLRLLDEIKINLNLSPAQLLAIPHHKFIAKVPDMRSFNQEGLDVTTESVAEFWKIEQNELKKKFNTR